ncbi:MAG: hypothetical protein IJ407_00330 [Clostridia bacterium]|nr:hypothetical protein [Clostridia bacterium]
MKRWLVLLLILSLTLALFCGCKTKNEEDFTAEVDSFVEQDEDDTENKDIDREPTDGDEEPADTKDPVSENQATADDKKEPTDDTKEPIDENQVPANDNKEPADDTKEPADGNDGEATPVTKETSGTPVTFLIQNLKTSGTQKGVYGERGGYSNTLYNRSRRLRAEIQDTEADVVLGCEGKTGWIDFFETDPYISENYGLVYKWCESTAHGAAGTTNFNDNATPILYRKSRFELADSGYFWYGDTPDEPSLPFGDATSHFRICSWAKLRDKQSGEEFYAYAIHIHDTTHLGGDTGIKSMGQLISTIDKLPEGSYAFLGGDYNIAYRSATYYASMEWDKMIDLQDMALNMKDDGLTEIGNTGCSLCSTWETGETQDYHDVDTSHNARHIDHLMAKPNPHMAVDYWSINWEGYEVPEEQVKFGYVSDHYGVVVKVRIGTDADYSQYQVEH